MRGCLEIKFIKNIKLNTETSVLLDALTFRDRLTKYQFSIDFDMVRQTTASNDNIVFGMKELGVTFAEGYPKGFKDNFEYFDKLDLVGLSLWCKEKDKDYMEYVSTVENINSIKLRLSDGEKTKELEAKEWYIDTEVGK